MYNCCAVLYSPSDPKAVAKVLRNLATTCLSGSDGGNDVDDDDSEGGDDGEVISSIRIA